MRGEVVVVPSYCNYGSKVFYVHALNMLHAGEMQAKIVEIVSFTFMAILETIGQDKMLSNVGDILLETF